MRLPPPESVPALAVCSRIATAERSRRAATAIASPDRNGIAAAGEVLGQGTVLQIEGQTPQLCLGAVAESYPPQCGGPEILEWDWDAVDLEETASDVTWGTYAVVALGRNPVHADPARDPARPVRPDAVRPRPAHGPGERGRKTEAAPIQETTTK